MEPLKKQDSHTPSYDPEIIGLRTDIWRPRTKGRVGIVVIPRFQAHSEWLPQKSFPAISVTADGTVYHISPSTLEDDAPWRHGNILPELKDRFPAGDYYVFSATVTDNHRRLWGISPLAIGQGGLTEVHFGVCSETGKVGAIRIAVDHLKNPHLEEEYRILKKLAGRPEIAETISYGVLIDKRRVNICEYYDTSDPNLVDPAKYKLIDVERLPIENLIRLVLLEYYTHTQWIRRGVAYQDWQGEVPVIVDSSHKIVSFIALDFSVERLVPAVPEVFPEAIPRLKDLTAKLKLFEQIENLKPIIEKFRKIGKEIELYSDSYTSMENQLWRESHILGKLDMLMSRVFAVSRFSEKIDKIERERKPVWERLWNEQYALMHEIDTLSEAITDQLGVKRDEARLTLYNISEPDAASIAFMEAMERGLQKRATPDDTLKSAQLILSTYFGAKRGSLPEFELPGQWADFIQRRDLTLQLREIRDFFDKKPGGPMISTAEAEALLRALQKIDYETGFESAKWNSHLAEAWRNFAVCRIVPLLCAFNGIALTSMTKLGGTLESQKQVLGALFPDRKTAIEQIFDSQSSPYEISVAILACINYVQSKLGLFYQTVETPTSLTISRVDK